MTWDDFYDRYCDWSESTVKSRISSLEDIGNGEEIVDVVLNLSDEKIRGQLVSKAMKLGVKFTREDFMNFDGELSDDVYADVAKYGGFYLDNPYFDENNFDWNEFYAEFSNLPEDMLLRCIPRIKKFGDSDEVADAISSLIYPADDALYDSAVACGVKFTKEQIEHMGRDEDDGEESDEWQDEELAAQSRKSKSYNASVGTAIGLGVLIGLFKGVFGSKKRHNGRCNGDCANCPPHYGYRYGRWYYGHGHNYGCVFGGNKGGGGRD